MGNPTAYADYPNPESAGVQMYLTPGAPGIGGISLIKPKKDVSETLTDNYSFSGSALAQAEFTNHRLLYVTPELQEDLHLSGTTSITVKMSSSAAATNLSVWMVSLPWTEGRNSKITDNIITRGWADPQNAKSLTDGKPLKPGKSVEVTFDLEPDDQIIKKGQQIGIMIFSSDKEFTLHPQPGTTVDVELSGTSFELPVVGGTKAYLKAIGEQTGGKL